MNVYNDVWALDRYLDRIDIFGNNDSNINWGTNLIYKSELNCPDGSIITGLEGNYGDDKTINQLLSVTCKEKPIEFL